MTTLEKNSCDQVGDAPKYPTSGEMFERLTKAVKHAHAAVMYQGQKVESARRDLETLETILHHHQEQLQKFLRSKMP